MELNRSPNGHGVSGAGGGGAHLRPAGRGQPAPVRRPAPLPADPALPGEARAVRRPRRRGLRPRDGQGGRLLRHFGAGRHEPGDRHRRRLDGLGARSGHHRRGGNGAHRPRRLPGGGHHRHHPAHHQAQLPGAGGAGPAAAGAGGVLHRRHRPAGPGAHRHPPRRLPAASGVRLSGEDRTARLPAERGRRPGADRQGGGAHRPVPAAADPGRSRGHHLRRLRRAARAGGEGQHSRDHDAAGHRRLPRLARDEPGDAGNARHVLEQHRHQRVGPAAGHRYAVRRPGDGAPAGLRAGRPDRARGHRRRRDREERAARGRPPRRREGGADGPEQAACSTRSGRTGSPVWTT